MLEPQLAPHKILDLLSFPYPLLASEKLNGVRALVIGGQTFSRRGKIFPSFEIEVFFKHLQDLSHQYGLVFDGEIYSPSVRGSQLAGICNSYHKSFPSDISFYAFDLLSLRDWTCPSRDFEHRLKDLIEVGEKHRPAFMKIVDQKLVSTPQEVSDLYEKILSEGGEGLILRSPRGIYKHGRCTINEGNVFKLKKFDLYDAKLIGYEFQSTIKAGVIREFDEFGKMKTPQKNDERTFDYSKAGVLIGEMEGGLTVRIGSGLSYLEKKAIVDHWDRYKDRFFSFKASSLDKKDRLIWPTFVSWRD
jgi:DNA ligase 1